MKAKALILSLAVLLTISTVLGAAPESKAQNEMDHPEEKEETNPGIEVYTDKWGTIPETEQAPNIDGTLDDAMWQGAKNLDNFVTAYYNEPAEGDMKAKLTYDEKNLYIGLDYTSKNEKESLANFIVILNTDSAGDRYFRIPVKVKDMDRPFVNNWGPDLENGLEIPQNVQSQTKKVDGNVTTEIAIPFKSMDVDEVTPGDEWGFNVLLQHEVGTQPLSSWIPIRRSHFDDSGASEIYVKAGVADERRVGAIFMGDLPASEDEDKQLVQWQPEQFSLTYKSITEKQLSFKPYDMNPKKTDIQLKWKAPSGGWQSIDDLQVNKENEKLNVTFHHPKPLEDGLYQLQITVNRENKPDVYYSIETFDRLNLIRAGDSTFIQDRSDEDKTEVPSEPPSKEVKKVMNIIPEQTGFKFTGIPDQPQLKPAGSNFQWSPDQPWILTSQYTDLTYPNDKYPEDHVLKVKNRKGEVVEYPYYEDENGKRYFLTAHIWYKQKEYALRKMDSIANKDPLGAARLLYRFAQVYEGYVPTNDYLWHQYPISPDSGPPYAYWGGTWNRWSIWELDNFGYLVNTFNKIKDTNALEVLGEEVGKDVKGKIVEGMLKPSVEFVRTYWFPDTTIRFNNWIGLTDMGKAFDDPSYIHEAVEKFENFALTGYLFDGFHKTASLSYHESSLNNMMKTMDNLQGWSDPEGYISPRSGTRFDHLDMREKFPALKKAEEIPKLVVYPNGKFLPTGDTWASDKSSDPQLDAGSFMFPASGIARLARGTAGEEDENNEYFGVTYDFPSLEISDQSAPVKIFPGSGTLQLQVNGAAGQYISFAFDVPKKDTYEIDLKPFRAGSYGRYDVKIDGQKVTNIDFYGLPGGPRDFEKLVTMELTKGTHHITFQNTGKNEDSSNYVMGVVQLALLDDAAQKERDEAEQQESKEEGDPTQLYLTFQPKYFHKQHDPLNLTLFDEGQELLPDIGYTHTFYRQWTNSTLAHNTVVVDSEDMHLSGRGKDGGDIDVFAPRNSDVQVMRAHEEVAYPQTDTYSREPWLIQFPNAEDNEGYVLDLFRVSGGDRHEYTLQGDANHDASFETDLSLSDYGPYLLPDGVEVRQPETEQDKGSAEGHYYGYIYVRDVKEADLSDGKYELTLKTEEDGENKANMKITGLVEPGQNELFLGKSPSLRATRLHGTSMDNNNEAVKYMMPKMVLRREGNDLTSNFITAMEPYANGESPRIDKVERLQPDQSVKGDLAVKVTYGDTTDIILSSLDPDQPLVVDDMTLHGKMGMIRFQDGEVQDLSLVGGTLLRKGHVEITDEGPVTGNVIDIHRQATGDDQNAFITDTPVPADLEGHTLVITHADGKTYGYEIEKMTTANGQTVIDIGDMDPGFELNADGTSALKFYPFTEWAGAPTFRIENTVQGIEEREVSVDDLQQLIEQFDDEGAFENEQAVRALQTHLTAVGRYETQEVAEKVIKHMTGFTLLLDHQRDNEWISEAAYNALLSGADAMLRQWQ